MTNFVLSWKVTETEEKIFFCYLWFNLLIKLFRSHSSYISEWYCIVETYEAAFPWIVDSIHSRWITIGPVPETWSNKGNDEDEVKGSIDGIDLFIFQTNRPHFAEHSTRQVRSLCRTFSTHISETYSSSDPPTTLWGTLNLAGGRQFNFHPR